MKPNPHIRKTACAALAAANLILTFSTARAQQPPAPAPATTQTATEEMFSFELGRASVDRGAAGTSLYTVAATKDYASKEKGGKVRLMVVGKEGTGTLTTLMTINTGKYKTVAQLSAMLADVFRKYLAAEPANQEIGKIGDVNHGGEIRFFAESREVFRYDWTVPGETAHSTKFKRGDIEAFLGILTHPKAVAR